MLPLVEKYAKEMVAKGPTRKEGDYPGASRVPFGTSSVIFMDMVVIMFEGLD